MNTIKRYSSVLALLIAPAVTTACQDEYQSLFLDPERSSTAKIEYLFTQALIDADFPIHYGEWFWQVYENVARWAQVAGAVNDQDMMQPLSDQWQNNWRDYYARAAMDLKEIRVIYDALPADQKPGYAVYLHLGKIVNAFTTARTTDMWGAIPYSEAFTARQTVGQNLFPKFDTQESVYDAILKDLKDASDSLRTLGTMHSALARQDLLLKGDVAGWRRFANSLRLRLAMRLSEVAPTKAQPIVQEILANPGLYPLVETNAQNVAWYMGPGWIDDHNSWGNRGRGTRERPTRTYAPKVMVDIMLSANDPRIPIVFDTNAAGLYVGLPSSPDAQPLTINRQTFAYLDSLMFAQNDSFPGFVMTAAEVAFLKAEAFMRTWAPGNAQAAYEEGLRESIAMYYQTYNRNGRAPDVPFPAESLIVAFINDPDVAYNGSLERIAIQKWIHFGIVQPYEAWAELRRTDYPVLPPDVIGSRPLPRTVRLVYPSTEVTNNRQNYEAVRAQDTPTTRVWWDVR
jgi:SusD/RagB-like outer membrane lipoprotein